LQRIGGTALAEFIREPRFHKGLLLARDGARRMARQIGKLHGNAGIAAAFVAWCSGPAAEAVKQSVDGAVEIERGTYSPSSNARHGKFRAELQRCRQQVILAAEVVVERALGNAGSIGNRLERHARETVPVKQLVRRFQNLASCSVRRTLCAPGSSIVYR
jgi:hypothetical protein